MLRIFQRDDMVRRFEIGDLQLQRRPCVAALKIDATFLQGLHGRHRNRSDVIVAAIDRDASRARRPSNALLRGAEVEELLCKAAAVIVPCTQEEHASHVNSVSLRGRSRARAAPAAGSVDYNGEPAHAMWKPSGPR